MAKKKKQIKQTTQPKQKKKNSQATIMIVAVVALLVMAGYLITANKTGKTNYAPAEYSQTAPKAVAVSEAELIETRPIVPASEFGGMVGTVYGWAAEIPGAFDALYCYCKCKENPMFKHKTLLTCYTDGHASQCGICLNEGKMAHELTKEGKSPREIRKIVDDYYAKFSG
jgi:hypothetical protein